MCWKMVLVALVNTNFLKCTYTCENFIFVTVVVHITTMVLALGRKVQGPGIIRLVNRVSGMFPTC